MQSPLAFGLILSIFTNLFSPSLPTRGKDSLENAGEKGLAVESFSNAWQHLAEHPEELPSAQSDLVARFEQIQTQMNEDLNALQEKIQNPKIMDRYQRFITHYKETVQPLVDQLKTATPNSTQWNTLKTQIDAVFKNPDLGANKNPTPFQIAPAENLTKSTFNKAHFPQLPANNLSNFSLKKSAPQAPAAPAPAASPALQKSAPPAKPAARAPRLALESSSSSSLEDLAESLHYNPLEIYNYVYNEISFTPYYGVKKGAYNTYLEKTGNDMDTALLLQELLNISGYETNLINGQVLLTPEQAENLVAMDDPTAAAQLLANTQIPIALYVDSSGDPVYIMKEHAWLEAYLPYQDYRGSGDSTEGYEWIPLDASLKETFSSQQINIPDEMGFNVQDFYEDYLTGSEGGSPQETFQSQIESFLTGDYSYLTYDDVLTEVNQQSHTFEFLPNTLPYSVVQEYGSYSDFPSELSHQMSYTVKDGSGTTLLSTTQNVEDLANQQVVLGYEAATSDDQAVIDSYGSIYLTPPYLIDLKPVLRINGTVVATGTSTPGGTLLTLQADFLVPNRPSTGSITQKNRENISINVNAGNDMAMAMNTDRVVPPEFYPQALDSSEFVNDQKLYRTALNYLSRLAENQEEIGSVMGGSYTNAATRAFVFNGVTVTYLSGVPQSFEWKGLRLDSSSKINYFSYFGDIHTHQKEFDMLFGLESSLDESSIFEDDYDVEAMSTVKGLRLINQGAISGVSMVKLDSSTVSTLDSLALSSSTKATLRSEIDAGYTVYTASKAFTYLNWTGLVYITLDTSDGDGGYIIGEGLNGGYTVETWPGFSYFTLSHAEAIRASIVAPTTGSTYPLGSSVYYEVHYEADYKLFSYTYTDKWTEKGYYKTTYLNEGTYYIASGYGTGKYVTFTLHTDYSDVESLINKSLLFPKCDSIEGSSASFTYPCETGRTHDGIPYNIDMIVIHYTAGSTVTDAYNGWLRTKDGSAQYIVDRNGSIYQIIKDENESYNVKRDSSAVNARSIGIEIVNEGYNTFWLSGDDTEYYDWNGHNTWEKYPPAQYEAVQALVKYLCEKYSIPKVVFRSDVFHGAIDFIDEEITDPDPSTPENEDADEFVQSFKGVVGHSALQGGSGRYTAGDKKFDPGPLFDFDNLFD